MSELKFLNIKDTVALDIYLEGKKSKTYVGRLTKEKNGEGYNFTYDKAYLYSKKSLSLGPELPLTKEKHLRKSLFPAFADRIPSRDNPAYVEYCLKFGISPDEGNPFILLATIGRKGPSSFVFEPVIESTFNSSKLKEFREFLGLTIREFSAAFDISPAILNRIEQDAATGKATLKRMELYYRFPEVAYFEVERNGSALHSDVKEKLLQKLTKSLERRVADS